VSKRRVLVVHAHPDAGHGHFGDALVERYAEASSSGGLETRVITLNQLDFPLIDSASSWRAPEARQISSAPRTISAGVAI